MTKEEINALSYEEAYALLGRLIKTKDWALCGLVAARCGKLQEATRTRAQRLADKYISAV